MLDRSLKILRADSQRLEHTDSINAAAANSFSILRNSDQLK